ncbi:hypothetical protein D3C72_1514140 [compost metagenome]
MSATVMPAQHALRQATCSKQPQDALNIGDLCIIVTVFIGLGAGHLGKELGWWQLPLVTHHNHLTRACNGPQRIHRLDLAGLVHHQQIKTKLPGRQELGYR